ncbi:hypothetical protein RIF29_29180 [Crotalaria pallida]|uniref:BRO1 domain-containing protein n=1 Tax=Crotalaria pallida TaxID=3830 RepID=A0AAN9I048_CROPI
MRGDGKDIRGKRETIEVGNGLETIDKASVLFNLGVVYSQIGLSYDRNTVNGRRRASHAFVVAAGSFAYSRENASMKASVGVSGTMDLSVECARVF